MSVFFPMFIYASRKTNSLFQSFPKWDIIGFQIDQSHASLLVHTQDWGRVF